MDIAQDGNLFPREDLLEAVAQSDWRDQPVPAVAWLLGSLGCALVALGAPELEPLAMDPTGFSAAGKGLWVHPVHGLARLLGGLGLGIESAWYLLSALSTALALPALGFALRALGIGTRLAFTVALVAMSGPAVFGHGRLPSDYGLGVLGSAVALGLACAPSDPGAAGQRGYGVRLGVALVAATLLHGSSLYLAPALLLVAWARGRLHALVPVAVAAAAAFAAGPWLGGASAGPLLDTGPDRLLTLGALGLVAPLAWMRSQGESLPPIWMGVWLLAGLVGSSPMLTPILAALGAGALARFARPDNALRLAAAMGALQLSLSALSTLWLLPTSNASGLAGAGPDLFQEGDVVLTVESERTDPAAYLVRRRFGVSLMTASAPGDGASVGVIDIPSPGRLIALHGPMVQAPWVLDPVQGTITKKAPEGAER